MHVIGVVIGAMGVALEDDGQSEWLKNVKMVAWAASAVAIGGSVVFAATAAHKAKAFGDSFNTRPAPASEAKPTTLAPMAPSPAAPVASVASAASPAPQVPLAAAVVHAPKVKHHVVAARPQQSAPVAEQKVQSKPEVRYINMND